VLQRDGLEKDLRRAQDRVAGVEERWGQRVVVLEGELRGERMRVAELHGNVGSLAAMHRAATTSLKLLLEVCACVCVFVFVCVCVREKEKERGSVCVWLPCIKLRRHL